MAEDALGAPAGTAVKSMEEMQSEIRSLQQQNAAHGKALSDKRAALDSARRQLGTHEKVVAELLQRAIDAESSEQSTAALAERQQQLKAVLAALTQQHKQHDSQVAAAESEKEQATETLQAVVAESAPELGRQEKELLELKSELATLGRASTAGADGDLNARLAQALQHKQTCDGQLAEAALQLQKLEATLQDATKRVNFAASERKNLDANVKLRQATAELRVHERSLAGLKEQLRTLGWTDESGNQLGILRATVSEASGKVERVKGMIDTLEVQRRECDRLIKVKRRRENGTSSLCASVDDDISKEQDPSHIDASLCGKVLDLEATRLAIKDLEEVAYFRCLSFLSLCGRAFVWQRVNHLRAVSQGARSGADEVSQRQDGRNQRHHSGAVADNVPRH